jgi:Domain of unknown function (DUF5655)/Domain of unknown function (DUF4287)
MVDDATANTIANLPERTGRSLEEWLAILAPLGLERHSQILGYLKGEHAMSHGYANLVAHIYLGSLTAMQSGDELVAAQYRGPKAALRPIYERLVAVARDLGDDVEVAPKKTSVSLRRRKQFALLTPASRARIDLGLNLRGDPPTERLREAGGMCTHKIAVTEVGDIDDELVGLLRRAYEQA